MQKMNTKDVELFVDGNEKYIQVNDVDVKDIEKVWENLAANYPGFVIDFCFRNTLAPEKFLLAAGASVLNSFMEMRLLPKDFIDLPTKTKVVPVTMDNFVDFAALHDNAYPDMYWSSRHLLANFDTWDIFIIQKHGEIMGYAIMRDGTEIYCVHANSLDDKIALITTAVKQSFNANIEGADLVFMVDRDNFTEVGAALHLGFRRKGYHITYRARI